MATITRERLTVSTVVKTLTANVYSQRVPAVIACEGGAMRYTLDGTDPEASTKGIKVQAGDIIILDTYKQILGFKIIRDGAVDGTIECVYGD